ncbi:MAG TPA: low specificity L-threonine aldolase [Terriglobales bacterium]|jgi:threonine aldolase|nr:low specificity L-threonine aldolase [Terriglobales bacterium]
MGKASSQAVEEQPPSLKSPSVIDLRSDTVTRPTPAMRQAMAEAEVGDDVYGEDPTVNRLEAVAARIFEREAALFVPTGTMGNQIAIKVHTRPGQEIICEERAHILDWEMGMPAFFSGCVLRTLHGEDGVLTWPEIKKKIPAASYARAQTGLIEIENTHNMAGGTITPVAVMEEICDAAHERGIPVHLDGARVFNAACSLKRPVAEVTRKFDSVMFCLSKGLGAPVGSMLVGTRAFVDQARSIRKALGGGMRQAGVLAAAGIIALEVMSRRLHEDHANAKFLAESLAHIPGLRIHPEKVQTNIVIFDVSATGMDSGQLLRELRKHAVIGSAVSDSIVRLVTHMDVSRSECEQAAHIIGTVCSQ